MAIVLGTLVVGGVTTYAAATETANAQFVSLSGTPAIAPGAGAVAPDTTTTTAPTTVPTTAPAAPAPSVDSATGSPGIPAQQTIGIAILPGSMTVTPSAES